MLILLLSDMATYKNVPYNAAEVADYEEPQSKPQNIHNFTDDAPKDTNICKRPLYHYILLRLFKCVQIKYHNIEISTIYF